VTCAICNTLTSLPSQTLEKHAPQHNTFWHRFVFLPMLYELVTGELKDWEVAPVFTDLLEGTPIEFVHGV